MPVLSFLAYPENNMKEQLIKDLSALDYCDIKVADNDDVLILITDTPDEETNKELLTTIKNLASLQSLSMTFGHVD